jgi:hypothetical protein
MLNSVFEDLDKQDTFGDEILCRVVLAQCSQATDCFWRKEMIKDSKNPISITFKFLEVLVGAIIGAVLGIYIQQLPLFWINCISLVSLVILATLLIFPNSPRVLIILVSVGIIIGLGVTFFRENLFGDPYLYDNFNNSFMDGGIDKTHWHLSNSQGICTAYQSKGSLILKNQLSSMSTTNCFLKMPSKETLGRKLNLFEVKMKISNDLIGENVNVALVMTPTTTVSNFGWASCGLVVHSSGVRALFYVTNENGDADLLHKDYLASFDKWHNMRMIVNTDDMAISCFIDDHLIDTFVPQNVASLKDAVFDRYLQPFFDINTSVTVSIDDVRVNP